MIAIIGAGMAGLACARKLADAGRPVVVFDKGRGLGGRIATRRTDVGSFDHGAQYATVKGERFAAHLSAARRAGAAAAWTEAGTDRARMVGTPGMTALVKPLAAGLDIHRSTKIAGLQRSADGWRLQGADGTGYGPYDQIVLTAPAPQSIRLLGDAAARFPQFRQIAYAPCWTLMAAFETRLDAAPVFRGDGALAWMARNSAKPGRAGRHDNWVAQAAPDWSRENLEIDREDAAARLRDLMADALGMDLPEPAYLAAHRWRYARVEQALGDPCLYAADTRIGFAGDGFLGGRIEAAFDSGEALADRLLAAAP